MLRRLMAMVLVCAMTLATPGYAVFVREMVDEDSVKQLVVVDDEGNEVPVDEAWEEDHPYGAFALSNSELVLSEDGETQIMTVYRLGGSTGKASAVLYYQPAVAETENGYDYSSAISAHDITIQVEDALPITAYQPWGMPDPAEYTDVTLLQTAGVDGEDLPCTLLYLDTQDTVEDYQWYVLVDGEWNDIIDAEGPEIPVGDEDLETYDFRCEFTVDGITYCTDSLKGEAYVQEEVEELPEIPADLDLNPEPTFSELMLTQEENAYSGFLFEVCFADGEDSKEVRITAKNDDQAEIREFAAFTIVDSVGGEVFTSMNSLALAIQENDNETVEPVDIAFVETEVVGDKSDGSVEITVRNNGGTTTPVTVEWALEEGTAVAGTDYADAKGVLTFYGDGIDQVIKIDLINDQVESYDEKNFTVKLSQLKGDDNGTISVDSCTVAVYNTDTGEELNLPSSLNDIEAVDASTKIDVAEGATVANQVITGTQVTEKDNLDTLSAEKQTTIEWDDDNGDLETLDYYNRGKTGRISFYGGGWGDSIRVDSSLSSKGGTDENHYKQNTVDNMGSMYYGLSARIEGGAEFASGWDRIWYGDDEYAYTYYKATVGNKTQYWDCSPVLHKEGLSVRLSFNNPFRVYKNWDYSETDGCLTLGVFKNQSREASDKVNAYQLTSLERRTFDSRFGLEIFTANDGGHSDPMVATYLEENYKSIIDGANVDTHGGGNDGLLYQGSDFFIDLGNTFLNCTMAVLVDGNGDPVYNGTIKGNRITFSDVIAPPDGDYTVQLHFDRTQDLKINVTTSAEVNDSGDYKENAFETAQQLFDSRANVKTYSGMDTTGVSLTGSTQNNGVISYSMKNLQCVNFGLPAEDIIVYNGRSYAGNETIYLTAADLATPNLNFFYYHEDFVSAQRPMVASIEATAVYFDGSGNGQIDGHWDAASGVFIVDESQGDCFVALMDGDYEETMFQPVMKDGKVCQYFIRAYYTANPVCLMVPEGHEADERMQVMPNFITDVTNSSEYERLTAQQKGYRTIVSGKTQLSENGGYDYSADNHMKYTAAATVYSYVDMPLGGDTSPSRPMTNGDLNVTTTNGSVVVGGTTYMVSDGLVYYWSATAPSNCGDAVYIWEPQYKGNLLYDFATPEPIYIPHSLAGSNIPIATQLEPWYLLTDGTYTTATPTDGAVDYAKSELGKYIVENRAAGDGIHALNSYLGAFAGNDTFALVVQEQTNTTDGLLSGMSTMADGDSQVAKKETISRGTVGTFPNSEYMQQAGSSNAGGGGDSSGQGEYEEFSVDAEPNFFSFSSKALAIFGLETDGNEICLSIGFPVYAKDNGEGTGSSANTLGDIKDTANKVKDFIKSVKNGDDDKFKNLAGDDLDTGNLKSKSVEFSVNIALGITLAYNTLDNSYQFSEAAFTVTLGIELRLQYRFTPAPIFYVYAQFSAEGSVSTGLGQDREAVLGDDLIPSDKPVKLLEKAGIGNSNQYYFTTDKKGFSMTFDGKVYMEIFEFTDKNNNNVYDDGDIIGDTVKDTTSGYLSSDGKNEVETVFKIQDGFALDKPVVVVLTVMNDGDDSINRHVTITQLALIEDVEKDLYWNGFAFEISGGIEVGLGVGVEIVKGEIFMNANIGIAFTLGETSDDNQAQCSFDEFNLAAAIGFRVLFLFFEYEMELISYHLQYSLDDDEDGNAVLSSSGWSHGWSALGGYFNGDYELSAQATDDVIDVYITTPSAMRARVYDNNVTGRMGDMEELAFETEAEDFQVSGYGSSVNAYQLVGNVSAGYDYQIVTVGDKNYVVYTGTNSGAETTVDQTELYLSELDMTKKDDKDVYGLVNPIAGGAASASQDYVVVDGDGTGDLDFTTWADGTDIHVVWVSYADVTTNPVKPTGNAYGGMTAGNFTTVTTPNGGTYDVDAGTWTAGEKTLTIDGTAMTVSNYKTLTLTAVPTAGAAPVEEDYYTTTETTGWSSEKVGTGADAVTWYFPDTYANLDAAKKAFADDTADHVADKNAYNAYVDAKDAYDDWTNYFSWFDYYYRSDAQNQVTAASRNTVVKHATFDTVNEDATGFTDVNTLSDSSVNTYYFMPKAVGDVAVYAQSVPYDQNDLDAYLADYEQYLRDTQNKGYDESETSQSYADGMIAYRMAYQQSLASIYGGNSKLTITAPDGTAYENGVMYVSKHQENGNGDAVDQTNEIIGNLSVTQIGNTYYLAYTTLQETIEGAVKNADLRTTTRLYLRSFTVADDTVTWSDPYLLRTLVDFDQDSTKDGIYTGSSLNTGYQDPYFANLNFLTGQLGDKLVGEEESFQPFAVDEETFLLFEMNGNSYVIDQDSLNSILDTDDHKGTIYPFFTYEQLYGDAMEDGSTESLTSGKSEVVIGADGDGNVVAVYTSSVPNTANNAIYIAYWDPDNGTWSDGVMLAMNQMDVYENIVANGLDGDEAKAAYLNFANDETGSQFTFSNLQIALGRPATVGTAGMETMSADGTVEITVPTAQAIYGDFALAHGINLGDEMSALSAMTDANLYALQEQAELAGLDVGKGAATSELLILTQGALQKLQRTALANDPSSYVITTTMDEKNVADPAQVGVYAISYGKGEQQVGNVAVRFAFDEFTTGSRLHANVNFRNVGDTAIRGDDDGHPVTVKLMLAGNGGDETMATWEIAQNITPGQAVSLTTDNASCTPLTRDLGTGDYFYITVSEDNSGYVANPYRYSSYNDANCKYQYDVEDKPELAIEGFTAKAVDVTSDGDATVELSLDATNRGKEVAEDVFVQFSYLSGYDDKDSAIYSPLDLTDSKIHVSQQKYIADLLTAQGANDLANGIIYLGTDDSFYTARYYISAQEYKDILDTYYRTEATAGLTQGSYNGISYWYDNNRFISAYAAYTAGQEAVAKWSYDSQGYYNNSYSSYEDAKAAADALRKMDYILTADQYNALESSEQSNWTQSGSEYFLNVYTSYEMANAAYQEALEDNTQSIKPNYMRTIEGTVNVDPALFLGKVGDNLGLRVEIFSQSSNASSTGGLYTSNHGDEYFDINNVGEVSVAQTGFISSSAKIVLAQNSTHRISATASTTRGTAPNLTVIEVEDGHDELSTLYFAPGASTSGSVANLTGSLVIVGRDQGEGVIHIVDEDTNTTYAITYVVAEPSTGVNIYNDDAQFTFYNADGTPYDPDKTNQDWKFKSPVVWTEAGVMPYLDNLSQGAEGAYFTFTTQASDFEFDLIGSAEVTSNQFAGSYEITGTAAEETSETIDFNNTASLNHVITVKITSADALFDVVRPAYDEGYTPSDDVEAPGLYWSRSFPAANSVKTGEIVSLTVYALDPGGLQSLTFNGTQLRTGDANFIQTDDGLWSYTFPVTENGTILVTALDTSGNTTSRSVKVDWFGENDTTAAGRAPALDAKLMVSDDDAGTIDMVVTDDTRITAEGVADGEHMIIGATATDTNLSYATFSEATAEFTMGADTIRIEGNGYYMVRADAKDSSNTWSAAYFPVYHFTAMPTIDVATADKTDPNAAQMSWVAKKDDQSADALKQVTVNGVTLVDEMSALSDSFAGQFDVRYGGSYTFKATDEKNISGQITKDVAVPIYIPSDEIFTTVDAWGQAVDGNTKYGTVTIDFNTVTGGDSVVTTGALEDYYGSYEFTVVAKDDYDVSDNAWLDTQTWKSAAHNATVTWDGLEVTENGSTTYVVVIRDQQNPTEYATMATQEITLSDNAIDVVSSSSRLASSELVADGEIYATADKGLTGQYEFAVLDKGGNFKDSSVEWKLADLDSEAGNSVSFQNIGAGDHQIAIRTLVGDSEAFVTAKQNLITAQSALAAEEATIQNQAEAKLSEINQANSAWRTAENTVADCQKVYDNLEKKLANGDKTVTQEQVDEAYDALTEAKTAESAAQTAYEDLLIVLGNKTQLLAQRASWKAMEEGDAKIAAYTAYQGALMQSWMGYYEVQNSTALNSAKANLTNAETAYDSAESTMSGLSATAYQNDSTLWDGMIVADITVGYGTDTSLKAVPKNTSNYTAVDGTITITAFDGSAYDGGDTIHYQFAVLPLEKEGDAVDYSADPTKIGDLNLKWHFADSLADIPNVACITDLPSAWYQVFVRVVYDSDPRDDMDMNTYLYDGEHELFVADLATLRAAYEASLAATTEKAIDKQVTAAQALYTAWEKSETDENSDEYKLYLNAIDNNADILAKLAVWQSADEDGKYVAYRAYEQAMADYFLALAKAQLDVDVSAYNALRTSLENDVAKAYEENPGYYATSSNTTAFVGITPVTSALVETKDDSENPVFTLRHTILNTNEYWEIWKANQVSTITVIYKDVAIVVPKGALESSAEAKEMIKGMASGTGDIVIRTLDGVISIVPVCLVEQSKIGYLYMGKGEYSIIEADAFFKDIDRHWAEENILFAAVRGLFNGVGDDQFAPDDSMTRGMMITLLYRLAGQPEATAVIPFTDVETNSWYTEAVRWGYENQVVNGVSDTQFAPYETLTREQMLTMLYRYLLGADLCDTKQANLSRYPDAQDISDYAVEAFGWGVQSGIVQGDETGRLIPKEDALRCQLAAIFERVIRDILS